MLSLLDTFARVRSWITPSAARSRARRKYRLTECTGGAGAKTFDGGNGAWSSRGGDVVHGGLIDASSKAPGGGGKGLSDAVIIYSLQSNERAIA